MDLINQCFLVTDQKHFRTVRYSFLKLVIADELVKKDEREFFKKTEGTASKRRKEPLIEI